MAIPKPEPRPERSSWFELVRTDSGWHCRLVGANGEVVMSSEVYTRRAAAQAVYRLCRGAITRPEYIDERTPAPPPEGGEQS
jgi:uncharacterized protein YegP (UPF0339 family)